MSGRSSKRKGRDKTRPFLRPKAVPEWKRSGSVESDLVRKSFELAAVDRPTILEIWAPTCVECRAMKSDLDAVAAEFSGRVDLESINAADELETARKLGVRGTPTLIGLREGSEVFRVTGRRGRADLRRLFEGVAHGASVRSGSLQDATIRLAAGLTLMGVGLTGETVWPVVALGAAVLTYAIASFWWERRG